MFFLNLFYLLLKANYITNKEIFVQLKMTYTKMLIYEFQLNGRDRESLKTFNEVNFFATLDKIRNFIIFFQF